MLVSGIGSLCILPDDRPRTTGLKSTALEDVPLSRLAELSNLHCVATDSSTAVSEDGATQRYYKIHGIDIWLVGLTRARSKLRNRYWQASRAWSASCFLNITLHELRLVRCSFQLTRCCRRDAEWKPENPN